MDAAAVTGILKVAVNKIAPLVIKEYSSIVHVKKDFEDLQDLAKEINTWLEAGGGRAEGNWLNKLKDIAYDVEDIVDEFQLEAEKHDADAEGGIISKYMLTKLKSFKHQCTMALKIKKVKKRFAEIVKQRTDVTAIVNSFPVAHPIIHHADQTSVELPLPIVGKTSVIGRDQDKAKLITKLAETKDQQKIEMVSIIGLGGSGKTTLAYLLYNDGDIIGKHFEVRLWVRVSQEYNVQKLVENLYEAITKCKSCQYPLTHMSETIVQELAGKRFLLVLDDVWTEDRSQWEKFMVHLETGAPGSKILLTTRSRTVAEALESTYLFDLPLLFPDDSWQLFHRSFGGSWQGLSSGFQDVGKEIVRKCGGVPLAIKVVAGVLRGKKRIEQWKTMRDSSLLYVQGKENEISACLKLSYFHMPTHLKPCFTICSLFPKGYMIDKEQLIDLWIAHDMIAMEDGVSYLECIAQEYFNYLLQSSFLQNTEERKDGSVVYGMHDLVHDLARSILGDEISLIVPKEVRKRCRYFTLIKQPENPVQPENHVPMEEEPENPVPKSIFGKARAVYAVLRSDTIDGMALEHAKHLRSVTVECPSASVPKAIFQIKYLKYLAMSRLGCKVLPEAISELWNLQALHITNNVDLEEIPESIGKLKKLRTLNFSGCRCLKSLPESIGDCPTISNINLWNCDDLKQLPNSIGQNTSLRVLNLGYTKFERLPSSIRKLKNLESLDLRWCTELRELPEGIDNLTKLQVLSLEGCEALKYTPLEIGQLRCVQHMSMTIFVAGQGRKPGCRECVRRTGLFHQTPRATYVMDTDDAREACLLRQSTSLKCLHVHFVTTIETGQPILDALEPPPGIENLCITKYPGEEYPKWMLKQVGDRVRLFTCLTVMMLSGFPKLKHLEGLVELPCLEKLELVDMPFLERISGGPIPSLEKLVMRQLPSLGAVWMITERTLSGGEEPHMQIGTCLSHLDIKACPKLTLKPHIPVSLEHLQLETSNQQLLQSPMQGEMSSSSSSLACLSYRHLKELEVVGGIAVSSSSPPVLLGPGRDFDLLQHMTALESLKIHDCHTITELPDVIGSCTNLWFLDIQSCPGIRMLPESLGQLRSLQQIKIASCHALEKLPESLEELCSLRSLDISELNGVTCLPQSMSGLTSLEELQIKRCPRIESLPEGMKGLTSLQELSIELCPMLCRLPESMGHLTSLRVLKIQNCHAIHQLPDCMGHLTSLEELLIDCCPGIKSLPECIESLTALRRLWIRGCPDLERRCEREKGEDWQLISRIPRIHFGSKNDVLL